MAKQKAKTSNKKVAPKSKIVKIDGSVTLEYIKSEVKNSIEIMNGNTDNVSKAVAESRMKFCVEELKNRELDHNAVLAQAYAELGLEIPKSVVPTQVMGDKIDTPTEVKPISKEPEPEPEPEALLSRPKPVEDNSTDLGLFIHTIFRLSGASIQDFDEAMTLFMKNVGKEAAENGGSISTTHTQRVAAWTSIIKNRIMPSINDLKLERDKSGRSVIRLAQAYNSLNEVVRECLIPSVE